MTQNASRFFGLKSTHYSNEKHLILSRFMIRLWVILMSATSQFCKNILENRKLEANSPEKVTRVVRTKEKLVGQSSKLVGQPLHQLHGNFTPVDGWQSPCWKTWRGVVYRVGSCHRGGLHFQASHRRRPPPNSTWLSGKGASVCILLYVPSGSGTELDCALGTRLHTRKPQSSCGCLKVRLLNGKDQG